jgi:N-acetylglucosaminyldiphosphoundecaprenol N-acetyl-beta-D-mannosaminyltransferase
MKQALALAEGLIASGSRGYVCVTGVHGVMEAQDDENFRRILNEAFMNTPDGMPMSWVGHIQGFGEMDRVYGPDFMLEMCQLSVERGYRHFLYGGNEGVAPLLAECLRARYPGLQVIGTYTPPFRSLNQSEEDNLFSQIGAASPHVLWVGLSTPKQEKFMANYIDRLRVPMMVGVGAAFDINSGQVKDAPIWMKRSGLQWFHRLLQEPRRLAKRYLINNPRFVMKIGKQLLTRNYVA